MKNTFLMKINVQDAFWSELGSIWAPKSSQKGGQKGPKRRQKRDQNDIKILIDFWIDFGSIWEARGAWIKRPVRNARGLARLFEFEEFEQEFEDYFENESRHAPTLRVAADSSAPRIPPDPVAGHVNGALDKRYKLSVVCVCC